jgi:hypothetical protein
MPLGDHTEDGEVEGDVNPAGNASCQARDPSTDSGFTSKRPHQTMRTIVRSKIAIARNRLG